MKTIPKKVKREVDERAIQKLGYRGCETCGHNGTKWALHVAHLENKGMGGTSKVATASMLILECSLCHLGGRHGIRIVESKPQFSGGG